MEENWYLDKIAFPEEALAAGDGCHVNEARALRQYLNDNLDAAEAAEQITAPVLREASPLKEVHRLWGLLGDALTDLDATTCDKTISLLLAIQNLPATSGITWSHLPGFGHLCADMYRLYFHGTVAWEAEPRTHDYTKQLRAHSRNAGYAEANMYVRNVVAVNDSWGYEVISLVSSGRPGIDVLLTLVHVWLQTAGTKLRNSLEFGKVHSYNRARIDRTPERVDATVAKHWASWKEALLALGQDGNITETLCQRPIKDRRGPGLRSIIAGLTLASIALILRMISKVNSPCGGNVGWSTTLWWDDAVVVLGLALIIPIDVSSVLLSRAGIGTDVWTLPFENITRILKIYYWDEDLYLTALPTVKISLLLTYLRIFQSRNFRLVCYFVIGLNICYAISFVLVSVFQCLPVSCAWTKWSEEYPCQCNNINAQGWAAAAGNVLLDVLTLSLPLPQLWAMKLNKRKKFWVMLMFCVGFLVTIISILRLQVLIEFGDSQNLTYDYVTVGYWSTAELHLFVICASMPSIRNLLRRYIPYVMGQPTTDNTPLSTTARGTEKSARSFVKDIITIRTMESNEENFISLDDYNSTNRTAPFESADEHSGSVRTPALDDYSHLKHTNNNRVLSLPSDDAYIHTTTGTVITAGDGGKEDGKKRKVWF